MRNPLGLAAALSIGVFCLLACATVARAASPKSLRVYIGTYTGPDQGKGIYLYDLDLASGSLNEVALAAETRSPSYLALSPDKKRLYAVGEVSEFQGKKSGTVTSFALVEASGKLTALNAQPTGGEGPCHVSVSPDGKNVFVANYPTGTIASLHVGDGGKLMEPASVIQHEGQGTDPSRQKGPHAHGIWPSPNGRFVLACDLGLDKVLVYKLDAETGKLTPNDPAFGKVPDGAGARHLAFGKDAKFAYVINEMGSTMTTFAWDGSSGALQPIQTISTLPDGFSGKSYGAEVVLHPSGKFVYGSNRGHNSIAAFKIDDSTGKLTLAGITPCGVDWPRNFNIDPTGQWLIAAGEKSGTLTVFKIDPNTGGLTQTGDAVKLPAPACVLFVPPWE
jgi:6-phosphogluconolactonase